MTANPFNPEVISEIRGAAVPLRDNADCRAVLQAAAGASIVLIGEATHGTLEFYRFRAELTRQLIAHHGFMAVAIEGDWPDAFRVNRFVHGRAGTSAESALAGFRRFPTWMWRNSEVEEFVGWLHARNDRVDPERRAGFYGLDLYSLQASMRAVIEYLEIHHPDQAAAARESYACFENFDHDTSAYAWATSQGTGESCEDAMTRELLRLRELREEESEGDEELFAAEQNARLAQNAEQYYRTMFRGHHESWNVRDRHMAETLEELREHLRKRGLAPKIVVWAHNSHLGDARATQMGASGELNLGQLVRENYPGESFLLGQTTYAGTVMAAHDWDEPGEERQVRAALPGSFESLFHQVGIPRFFLGLQPGAPARHLLAQPQLERAIGVVYRPETERQSHYFKANLADQFDAVVHFDLTSAVEPLEAPAAWEESEVPETYPSGV